MKTFRLSLGALFFSFLALGLAGCGDDDSGNTIPDAAIDSGASGTGGMHGGSGGNPSKPVIKPGKDAGQPSDAGDQPNQNSKPVTFKIPKEGGTTKVTLASGEELAFTFPKSAAGKQITLTPTSAASIGWPKDQFSAVIRMEPDGLKFDDPVIVQPSKGEMLLATFAQSKERQSGEMLELAKSKSGDKIEGLALHHFTLLGIIAAEFSCDDHNGWKATPSSQRCANSGSSTTYLDFVCDASPLCWTVIGHCCAAPGSTECHYTDPLATLSFTWQGPLGSAFPWCGPAMTVDAGHDAGQDASVNDDDAGQGSGGTNGGSGGQQGGSGGQQGGSGGQQGGSGGQQGGSGGQQGGSGGAPTDDGGVQGTGGTQGGSGGVQGSGGTQGGSGGVQGSGGTQGGSGGTGASGCKNPSDVDCGTGCVDLTSDLNNCGQCNHPCSTACVESQCATAVLGATCAGGEPFKVVLNPNVPNWSDFALYDMNNDGKLDLVGGNLYEIDVHTGVGDGSFNTSIQTGGYDAYKLAVGDFDHDGHGDVSNWNPDIDYGAATFGTFTELGYTPPMMFWGGFAQNTLSAPIASGDFNGDGASDIAEFTSGNNGVSELFMMQNRQYASSSTVAIGGVATGIATGDFDGDGKDDVALIIPGTALKIYPSPLSAATEINLAADNSGSSIAFGKLDADNKADIAIAHPSANEVGVVIAAFASGTSIYSIPIHADQVAIGDFTHDGNGDVVVMSGSALVILPGDGLGGFTTALGPFSLAPTAYNLVHIGDVNGDQTLDIVRRTYTGSSGNGFESLVTCPALVP